MSRYYDNAKLNDMNYNVGKIVMGENRDMCKYCFEMMHAEFEHLPIFTRNKSFEIGV